MNTMLKLFGLFLTAIGCVAIAVFVALMLFAGSAICFGRYCCSCIRCTDSVNCLGFGDTDLFVP
jgi:hypothetical protein